MEALEWLFTALGLGILVGVFVSGIMCPIFLTRTLLGRGCVADNEEGRRHQPETGSREGLSE